jgi:hypothetical protein
MGTGVPGDGSARAYALVPLLLLERSWVRVFSRSEVLRRRELDSRKTWRLSRLPREESSGRRGRDIVMRGMHSGQLSWYRQTNWGLSRP